MSGNPAYDLRVSYFIDKCEFWKDNVIPLTQSVLLST